MPLKLIIISKIFFRGQSNSISIDVRRLILQISKKMFHMKMNEQTVEEVVRLKYFLQLIPQVD